MKNIAEWIKAIAGVDAYKIATDQSCTTEIFYVGRKVETMRATETADCAVTVYCRNGDEVGDSSFAVYDSMGREEVQQATAKAVDRARLVHNPAYALPTGDAQVVQMPSNMTDLDPKVIASAVAKAVFETPCDAGGSINALEIFVTRHQKRVVNSTGLDRTQITYSVSFEAIPTWTEGESVELYLWYEAGELNVDAITAEVADKLAEVRDRYHARPLSAGFYDVVLRAKELHELMDTVCDNMNYGTVYSHANAYNVGDDLQSEREGDALSIACVAQVEGSSHSAVFDGDGVRLQDKVVVQDGRVVGCWGSSRFGQYLGEPIEAITGQLPCLSLTAGTMKTPAGTYLEVVSMSGIQLDVYSDYIGGEIRLAYLHEGDKVTPVTGISMSGQLSKTLRTIRLSEQVVNKGAYSGPALGMLPALQIL